MNSQQPVYIVDPTFEPGQVEPLTSGQVPLSEEIFREMMVDSLRRLEWQVGKLLKKMEVD